MNSEGPEHVIDATEATFRSEVLEYSMNVPVILDFWAPWCGPCKTIGPVLERLAKEYKGGFRLAKINVDENQQLAMAARVKSIPMVVAVNQGGFIDSFTGALPTPEIKRWISTILSAVGVDLPENDDVVPTDPDEARAFWQAKLEVDSEDTKAQLELGRLLLLSGSVEGAKKILENIEPGVPDYTSARAALELVELLNEVAVAGGDAAVRAQLESNPDDPEAIYLMACADASSGRFADAIEALIGLIRTGSKEMRPRAKTTARMVLAAAGRGDDRVEAQRRRLAALLF